MFINELISQNKQIHQQVVKIRRQLHKIPEIGLQQYKTTQFIRNYLSVIQNIQVQPPIKNVQTAIIARIKIQSLKQSNSKQYKYKQSKQSNSKQSKQSSEQQKQLHEQQKQQLIKPPHKQTFLFRCQLDALNWKQQSQQSQQFKSLNGLHHACGHDAHMSIMLITIKQLSKQQNLNKLKQLNRQIIFCFQPGQQGKGGARQLLQNYPQLLNNVNYCFAIHSANHLLAGYVSISSGNISANSSRFQIIIYGKGCHVMLPENAIDANLIGCNLVPLLYNLKNIKLNPLQQGTLSVVKIQGGRSAAMISDYFKIQGTLRMLSKQAQQKMKKYIQILASQYCNVFGARCEVKFIESYYRSVYNDKRAVDLSLNALNKILPKQNIKTQSPSFNGEDFCQFSQKIPSCYINIGSAIEGSFNQNGQSIYPLHSSRHRLDQNFMCLGVKYWVKLALGQYKQYKQYK